MVKFRRQIIIVSAVAAAMLPMGAVQAHPLAGKKPPAHKIFQPVKITPDPGTWCC